MSGNRTGKQIFQIYENGNTFHFPKWGNKDNNEVLEKLKAVNNRIIGLIKHILSNEIITPGELCIKYEILFVHFYNSTIKLFENQVLTWTNMLNIFTRKEMESRTIENLTPGYLFSFDIEREQLDYLNKFVEKIEEAQLNLENYYAGNADTI
jgi:hypothetical protein